MPFNPIALHALNPGPMTGKGNWTWLVPGDVPTLIDAGTGEPRFLDALVHALGDSRLLQVLVTHSHTDHASGATAIESRLPGLRFRKWPWPERDVKWGVQFDALKDGDRLQAGDTSVVAIHTPGHAPDHLCFWHEESRTLFGGDLAVKGTTVYIPTSLSGDLAAYLASLERILALDPVRILPAHGPVIEQPRAVLRSYIAHRLEREAQVIEALRAGDTDPDAIVARVYKSLKAALRPLARESVLAHLVKLESEGRAGRDGDRWHMIRP